MHFEQGILHIGGLAVTALIEEHGSPLYVYDAAVIRRQAQNLLAAFSDLPFHPFYAVKANDNLEILKLIREHGFGCDVVSPGEIFLAMHAGFAGDSIWFTCSNVSDDDLLSLSDPKIVINVNGMSEIDRCIRLQLPNPIALRVNPEVGAGHHRDVVTAGYGVKFGLDLAEIEDARGVAEAGGMRVVGLHAHIGSGVEDLDPLLNSARILLELSDAFHDLGWMNFGGGIAVPYKPGEREFPLREYGQRLGDIVGARLIERGMRAILEPGRYLVAPSGVLLTRVTSKRISAGHEWVGCDTGFNHLVRPSRYSSYHHIVNATRGVDADLRERFDASTGGYDELIVAGNLCESGDVFTRDQDGPRPRLIRPTRTGDILAFCDTGAYGFSMASHYNARLLPAEILVEEKTSRIIRRRQVYEDLLRGQTTGAGQEVPMRPEYRRELFV